MWWMDWTSHCSPAVSLNLSQKFSSIQPSSQAALVASQSSVRNFGCNVIMGVLRNNLKHLYAFANGELRFVTGV